VAWISLFGTLLEAEVPGEWLAVLVVMLILASIALLALVFLGGVGSTWDDKQ
jgi:hypothetical protein